MENLRVLEGSEVFFRGLQKKTARQKRQNLRNKAARQKKQDQQKRKHSRTAQILPRAAAR